ncbi:MAG: hypothetical protein MK095_03550, partial [Phycisphaerales bacterium]|nr:hypothetical protein [Phycisphaerales bacterium]
LDFPARFVWSGMPWAGPRWLDRRSGGVLYRAQMSLTSCFRCSGSICAGDLLGVGRRLVPIEWV